MSNQPKALRLADELADYTGFTVAGMDQAAAELRRLHELNQELLKALKLIASTENSALDLAYCKGIARAAIAKAEGKV
jgi:hypothetical protein